VELAGRVALVTGAGRRLGAAIAVGLARAGCDIAVHHHASAAGAEETLRAARAAGRRAERFPGDLRDSGVAKALPDRVVETFGRLDIVINSAAVIARADFTDITPEAWHDTIALNLSAAFFVSQGAAPHLVARHGKIVNLADVAAFEVWPSYLPLNISKAAVVMLTHGLARLLAPDVTVNAVAPGAILPPDDWPESARAHLIDTTPLKRLGDPDDIVRAVLFLLQSDYITGVVLPVDGGRLIR
jgi:pteridine reductase